MSTRGIYGIRKKFVKHNYEKLDDFFEKLVLVEENETPSFEEFQYCKKNKIISSHIEFSEVGQWYSEIRGMQGDFEKYANLLNRDDIDRIYMTNAKNFIKDSLFCEYGYIINLDTRNLEFWKGFQETPDETNRYGKEENDGYYPCKLSLEIPFEEIVNNLCTERIVECMNCTDKFKQTFCKLRK